MKNLSTYILEELDSNIWWLLDKWFEGNENQYQEFIEIIVKCNEEGDKVNIDNFVHLIAIESSLVVAESLVLNKAILNDFIKLINADGHYQGITVKPTHPKMKANFIKLGFNSFKDNKEILTYKL